MKRRAASSVSSRSLGVRALLVIAISAVGVAALLPSVRGQDRNFAGSIQSSYLYVHDQEDIPGRVRDRVFDGFTTELSVKLAVDFNEHISTNVKLCYGCHGVEIDMAYIDLVAVDELRFRAGRFNPAFGELPLRHDPANHRTIDKPLPYDMGRMLRWRDFNGSVMPSPYVDNGLEVSGTHWFGYSFQIDYAVYAVGGFRGDNQDDDFDFTQSRSGNSYYVDNNSRPSFGGRYAMTLDLAEAETTFTLGASGMAGYYDPDAELSYWIAGADFYARLKTFELRAEYLVRRTEMFLGDAPASRFKYGPGKNGFDRYMLKEGFYVEAIMPLLPRFELVGRFDGLRRVGNVLSSSSLSKRSSVLRYTLGGDVSLGHGVRVKLSGEYYDFNDFKNEIAAMLGVVAVL
jgi:hypothetical protein